MRFSFLFISFLCVLLFTQSNVSHADTVDADDVDFIGRYPGSIMTAFGESEYDGYTYPFSVNSYEKPEEFEHIRFEGQRSVRIYNVPGETNTLKVFRSIQKGLEEAGLKTRMSCDGDNNGCGYFFLRHVVDEQAQLTYYKYKFTEFYNLNSGQLHIYSGEIKKDGSFYVVMVVVAKSAYSDVIQYSIDMYEQAELETKALELTTEKMSEAINSSGKVILDGLFFETNSDVLLSTSTPSLKTISDYLRSNTDKKFLVVGHTDTKGSYRFNQALSHRRAESVMNALLQNYSIPEPMLKAVGIAFASPASNNSTDQSRAANRRVELVEVNQF